MSYPSALSPITLALLLAYSQQVSAALPSEKAASDSTIIVSAPVNSPLEVVSSPKTPRQPLPASDGSDYLKTIPGFAQIRNGGTNGEPVFRGMFGSRLRMLMNDSEMLGACGGRMDSPSSYLSPENFDLMTLIKGPQTVLWGPGNSAGTLRFERLPPSFSAPGIQGDASLVTGSNQRNDQNADISMGNQQGYIRLTGNHGRANDYQDGDGRNVPSQWKKWNSDIAIGWTPDADTLLELTAGQGNGNARYAGRGMDGSQFKRQNLGLTFKKENISETFTQLTSHLYYNNADHVMDNFSLRHPTAGMSRPMRSEVGRKTLGGRVMGTWEWTSTELRSGVDMQHNSHRRKISGNWREDASFSDYGMFSELRYALNQDDHLISGARADLSQAHDKRITSSRHRHKVMPAGFLRLEHHPEHSPVMLYAGLGYTERFPDYWELFSPTYGPDNVHSAFTQAKPEKTTQLDIGAKYQDKQLDAWVSAYVGWVDDFILFRYRPTQKRISQVDNVDALIFGGEMGASYQLSDHWKLESSISYAQANNRQQHRPLPQIPPLETRIGATWHTGPWSTTGLVRWVAAQHRVAKNEGNVVGKDFGPSASFLVLSANSRYQFTDKLALTVGIDNLLNKTYSEHLNLAGNGSFGYSTNTRINEPGRSYWAKVSLTF
ncbi:TonB-dependent copper receptor [Rosenbergiella sp. S61]|uniref:TonB-dependent copper receptor n=1 Tax=Rosenbergiella gaditana TaxID=2726987 RepID=A0ABS5STP1_9GAMM|nr:TonB-dependent copper receptor [Rosenbergiella gaditana]MBT0723391.1 TonB-dependent copper receptor [Rosenbergiella gaditana]